MTTTKKTKPKPKRKKRPRKASAKPPPNGAANRAQNLLNEERALVLKCGGSTYAEISAAIGFRHASSALRCVTRALKKLPVFVGEEQLKLEGARLESLYGEALVSAREHDLAPTRIKIALEILGMLHKIRGLDFAPANHVSLQQVNISGVNGGEPKTISGIMSSPAFTKYLADRDAEKETLPHAVPVPRAEKQTDVIDVHATSRSKTKVDVSVVPAIETTPTSLPAPTSESGPSGPTPCTACSGRGREPCGYCYNLGCSRCRECPTCDGEGKVTGGCR